MLKNLFIKLKDFIIQSKRVFLITKKPSKPELIAIVKVSGIGILIIGLLGFIITIMGQLSF